MNRSNHMLFMNLSYYCFDCVQATLILLFCSMVEMDFIEGVQHLVFVISAYNDFNLYHSLSISDFFCSSENSCTVMIMELAFL